MFMLALVLPSFCAPVVRTLQTERRHGVYVICALAAVECEHAQLLSTSLWSRPHVAVAWLETESREFYRALTWTPTRLNRSGSQTPGCNRAHKFLFLRTLRNGRPRWPQWSWVSQRVALLSRRVRESENVKISDAARAVVSFCNPLAADTSSEKCGAFEFDDRIFRKEKRPWNTVFLQINSWGR